MIHDMAHGDTKGLSQRGWSNVAGIMPRINAALEERKRRDNPNIDLATAENWLLRPELIELCKDAINKNLDFKVRKGPLPISAILLLPFRANAFLAASILPQCLRW